MAILQEIVDRHGDCEDFAKPAICKRCPLGNKQRDGRRVNCMDYLNIHPDMSTEEILAKYEDAATEELFKIEMDAALSED